MAVTRPRPSSRQKRARRMGHPKFFLDSKGWATRHPKLDLMLERPASRQVTGVPVIESMTPALAKQRSLDGTLPTIISVTDALSPCSYCGDRPGFILRLLQALGFPLEYPQLWLCGNHRLQVLSFST